MTERSAKSESDQSSSKSSLHDLGCETAPDLIELTRRVSECPPEFFSACSGNNGAGRVVAIIADHFRDHTHSAFPSLLNGLFTSLLQSEPGLSLERYLQLLALVVWLLHDRYFISRRHLAKQASELMTHPHLKRLSELVKAQQLIADPDRREELVRFCLDQLGLRPQGETPTQTADRLTSLNSVERQRILQETAEAQRRAREIREAMARSQALESASRYGE